MNKYIRITFIFIIFFIIINSYDVYAKCSLEELDTYKQMAEEVELSYEFDDNTKKFTIYVSNLSKELKAISGLYEYTNNSDDNIYQINGNFDSKEVKEIYIYTSNKTNCKDTFLTSKIITLPYYNSYSENELCIVNKEFELCKKWYNTVDYSDKEFYALINEYIEQKISEKEKSPFDIFIEFCLLYWYMFFIFIFIIIGVIFLVKYIRKKNKKIDL